MSFFDTVGLYNKKKSIMEEEKKSVDIKENQLLQLDKEILVHLLKDSPKGGPGGGKGPGKGSNRKAIIERIRKLNEKELEIEKLVKQFEENIKIYFDFIESQEEGKRLIAKVKSEDTSFSNEQLLHEFNSLTRKFILVKGKDLIDLFKKELKENLESFFDLFIEERCGE